MKKILISLSLSLLLCNAFAKSKEKLPTHSLVCADNKIGNKSFQEKLIFDYEMSSTYYEASGDLLEARQFKNENGDFLEIFKIKMFNNVIVTYIAASIKEEFCSKSEVVMTTDDHKRFGAILYENDKMISIPKAHNGWYLTAYGMKMYGAYALWGRTCIRGFYENLSSTVENIENKDKQLINILESENIYPLNKEARNKWNAMFDDQQEQEEFFTKFLRANTK